MILEFKPREHESYVRTDVIRRDPNKTKNVSTKNGSLQKKNPKSAPESPRQLRDFAQRVLPLTSLLEIVTKSIHEILQKTTRSKVSFLHVLRSNSTFQANPGLTEFANTFGDDL